MICLICGIWNVCVLIVIRIIWNIYIVMEVHERDRGEMLIDGNEPPSWCARKKMDICLYESQAKALKLIYRNDI